jgi:hypothetical protein
MSDVLAPAEIELDGTETDLNLIIDNIDGVCGRNDALREYIYALRDLQRAHNEGAYEHVPTAVYVEAEARVVAAFEWLALRQRELFRDYSVGGWQ